MGHGFRRGPEHAATGQQGAQHHRNPLESGKLWRIPSAQRFAGVGAGGDQQCHREIGDHQQLPEQTEVLGAPAKGLVDHPGEQLGIDEEQAQKAQHQQGRQGADPPSASGFMSDAVVHLVAIRDGLRARPASFRQTTSFSPNK